MILVRTDHPCLRVGRHSWYQSHYGPIFKNRGEDMLRCPYKDYSSLNRWQANRDLLSVFAFCKLLPVMTHLCQGKKVRILMSGDVDFGPVALRRDLLEPVLIVW
jgi:hypothetical protein